MPTERGDANKMGQGDIITSAGGSKGYYSFVSATLSQRDRINDSELSSPAKPSQAR